MNTILQEEQMDRLIVKAFGVNQLNFFGWLAAGLVIIALSLWAMAMDAVSLAIYLVQLGIFGVLLQMYLSLHTEKIERQSQDAKHL